jgi:hypothetical protein
MLVITWKDLLYQRGQTILNVLGLAIVIFSYLILAALAQTLEGLVKENRLSRNLIVIQADVIDPSDADLDEIVLRVAAELRPDFISQASPVIFRHILINDHLVQLRATPRDDLATVFRYVVIEGEYPKNDGEAMVGEGAVRAFGWGLDTSLRIYGRDFRVSGIFRSPGTMYASVWLPLETAQALFAPRRSSQFLFVQVTPGVDAGEVLGKLQDDPRLKGRYTVYFEENYTRRNTQIIKDLASLLRVVSMIALLGLSFGAYNATSLSIAERGREAAILRALGFEPGTIRLFLLVRALWIGLFAWVAGLGMTIVFASYQASNNPLFVYGVPMIYQVTPTNALAGLVWVAVLTLLGAWLASGQFLAASVQEVLRKPA